MEDKSRVVKCPSCDRSFFYQLVRVKCPHCDQMMVFPLPEYEFFSGTVGCEHCHRQSRLRIGGYYGDIIGRTVATTEPVYQGGHLRTPGGRLLSIKPIVPTEVVVVGDTRKIPDGPRQDLESAIKCLEIGELRATAVLSRRCVQSALRIQGIPEDSPSKMINLARQRGTLSELAKRQSDAVTFMGGKAAHPQSDPLLNLVESDIRQGLQMVRRVLLELFDPDQLNTT